MKYVPKENFNIHSKSASIDSFLYVKTHLYVNHEITAPNSHLIFFGK